MSTVTFTTSHNVTIRYEAASIVHRIISALIDFIIMGVAFWIAFVILVGSSDGAGIGTTALSISIMLFIFFLLTYPLWFEMFDGGRTPGKRIMKLRVVKLDGTPPSFMNYFTRWVIGLFEILLSSGSVALMAILLSSKAQRLGDIAAGTIVVRIPKDVRLTDIQVDATRLAAEDEGVAIPHRTYPMISVLSDTDIAIVRDVLAAYSSGQMQKSAALHLVERGALKIATKMNVPPADDPLTFLNTVLADYTSTYRYQ